MAPSRNCVIGALIAVVIIVAGGIGIYYAVSSKTETQPQSTDKLLVKSNDGTIKLYDRKLGDFGKVEVNETLFGIKAFDAYRTETIYYATAEPGSVIHSSNQEKHPDLPAFTANPSITAIAVDDVTKNVYIVNRLENQITVVSEKYRYVLPLKLQNPKDVILVPEKGTMIIVEESNIMITDMSGDKIMQTVEVPDLQAVTVDRQSSTIYFAQPNKIESLSNDGSLRTVISTEQSNIKSLAYKDKVLYFINKIGKSSAKQGSSFDTCRLDSSKCLDKCCEISSIHRDERLEQVKIVKDNVPLIKNPCEVDNGGCQHLCILEWSEQQRRCKCDVGWTLQPDQKSCGKTI